ncbi:hypothetical protein APR11_000023 [Nocardia amikacinitolerans]|uniref:hypothetical protein n=1 Tax=Nocardia amikacinitolerans TaxID=756689 RepID=UPI0020A4F3E7|nr:hypothetical protein [Nocardia amikacinitolerans]MCP2293619.1 hypothetical protein [Nocardia amikacinitolerans]
MSRPGVDLRSLDIIGAIENWWGDRLSDDLIARIATAPDEHLTSFYEYYIDLERTPIPQLPTGHLRPLIDSYIADRTVMGNSFRYLSLIPAASLYAHEIIAVDPIIISRAPRETGRDQLIEALKGIQKLSPLINSGGIHFYVDEGSDYSKNRHPSRMLPSLSFERLLESEDPAILRTFDELRRTFEAMDPDDAVGYSFNSRNDISYQLKIAGEASQQLHICSHDKVSFLLLQLALNSSRTSVGGGRIGRLEKLLALPVPRISGAVSQISILRNGTDVFEEWRSRLTGALSSIEGIGYDDDNWQTEAREILTSELLPLSERLKKNLDKSPAIRAATSGFQAFTLAGIGTVASGLLGAPITLPAAGLATAKVSEALVTYLKAKKESKKDKAVLDLITNIGSTA